MAENTEITILREAYERLLGRDALLRGLEDAGVKDWEHYGKGLAQAEEEKRQRPVAPVEPTP